VPGWRSRAERFDMAVLEAYEPIERRWQQRLAKLDVAVDEIRAAPRDPQNVSSPGGGGRWPIALARLIRPVWTSAVTPRGLESCCSASRSSGA
jgi:hypothetical protein